MLEADINYWAVLVSAVASMAIGFVWYSKAAFGTAWMKAIGKTDADLKKDSSPTMYVWPFLLTLIEAYVLAHIIGLVDATTLWEGVQTGLWMWAGFVLTTQAVNAVFEGRSRNLLTITLGYHLVYLIVAGAILALWV